MKVFLKKNKNDKEVCFAGTNESNCDLIVKLKSLQGEYKQLSKENDLLCAKYREEDGCFYRNKFTEYMKAIRFLENKHSNLITDTIEVLENYNKQIKLNDEIQNIKKKLGIE